MKTENEYELLASKIKDISYSMMSTIGSDGYIYSRPMANTKIDPQIFDGNIWYFTKKDSPKVYSIENDQHVNLAYSHLIKQHFVSISGVASLVVDQDKMEELWTSDMQEWFPLGLADMGLSLIRVKAHSAEIWDTPGGKMHQLAGLAREFLSGHHVEKNHHGKIIRITS